MSERVVDPSDFFSEDPPERIMGSECEYPVNGVFKPELDKTGEKEPIDVKLYFQRGNVRRAGHKFAPNYTYGQEDFYSNDEPSDDGNHFLGNGARIYPDCKMLEYASAEVRGPTQAAAADFAGIKVMQSLVENAGLEGSQVYRRVGIGHKDKYNNTSGYHENYLMPTTGHAKREHAKDVLESFFATRTWAMSGMVGGSFVLSQKSKGIGNGISEGRVASTTPGLKPIAAFRRSSNDITNGDNAWTRFEIRYADANLSRWATYMSFATTSLVLRMLEHYDTIGTELDEIRINNILNPNDGRNHRPDVLHVVAADMTLKKKFAMKEGENLLTAIDVQEKLALAAKKLSEKIVLPADELAAIDEWLKVCDDMRKADAKNHDYSLLADRVDWAARHTYLSRKFDGHEQLTRQNYEVVKQDLIWDRISSKGRGQRWWEVYPQKQEIVPQEQVDALVCDPPKNTRAAIRGNYIKTQDNNICRVNWSSVTFSYPSSPEKTIKMYDPYAYEIES